jgi:hypothetical protein
MATAKGASLRWNDSLKPQEVVKDYQLLSYHILVLSRQTRIELQLKNTFS